MDIIGVIPANGYGRRLGALPGSKELVPVVPAPSRGSSELPEPVCSCLLRALGSAGVSRALMVIRTEKWDIPAFLGTGERYGVGLAYVVAGPTRGPAESLDRAFPFIADRRVLTGFPDILFSPPSAVRTLIERGRRSAAALTLGLFPTEPGQRADRVEVGDGGAILAVRTRPERPDARPSWCLALWTPEFTDFLHGYLAEPAEGLPGRRHHATLGDVVQAAIEQGLPAEGVMVSSEPFLDIGTPAGLERAWRRAFGGRA